MFEITLAAQGTKASRLLARVGDALGETGVAPSDTAPTLATVVLFEKADEETHSLLEERRARGEDRLLAVAINGAPRGSALWRLLAAGAADVLCWDDDSSAAEQVAARVERWAEIDRLLDQPLVREHLVGESPAWRLALRRLVEIARFAEGGVLVTGQTGTGKELAARLIHSLDVQRRANDLVLVDCTTLTPELAGSELFGHERGAFTHAVTAREGAFSLAHGGTLFLDEVGELPLPLQAELLRVVQEGTFKRLGSNVWRQADFRLVCATHRDLERRALEGRFRQDLYFRLAAWVCRLPSLTERREDVPLLVRHFLRQRLGPAAPDVDPAVLDVLVTRDYPGNVRDLQLLVHRIAQRHVGPGAISVGDLPEEERPRASDFVGEAEADGFLSAARVALARGQGLKEIGNCAADAAVRVALAETGGSLRAAAERLGVTSRALQLRRAAWRQKSEEG